jgi:hypothetical protein
MPTKLDEKNIEDLHCKYSGSDTAYSHQDALDDCKIKSEQAKISITKHVFFSI